MRLDPKDLADPTSALVQAALQNPCGACKQPVGVFCLNTVNGEPLSTLGRYVHWYRLGEQ